MRPQSRKKKSVNLEGLLAYAGRVLSARAQTAGELRRKLAARAERPGDVDEVIRRLKESGYLDDQRFAETFASRRRDDEGFGKDRVTRDLLARRVAPALAKKAAEKAFAAADEPEMIKKFLERKYRGKDLGSLFREPRNLASAYRRLRLAGFSPTNCIQAIRRYANRTESLEALEAVENQ